MKSICGQNSYNSDVVSSFLTYYLEKITKYHSKEFSFAILKPVVVQVQNDLTTFLGGPALLF